MRCQYDRLRADFWDDDVAENDRFSPVDSETPGRAVKGWGVAYGQLSD
jgi:hypothetical protein